MISHSECVLKSMISGFQCEEKGFRPGGGYVTDREQEFDVPCPSDIVWLK